MASFSVPLLSICRGKLHRQVHVCDLLISYNHSPSTFTAVHASLLYTFQRSWIGQRIRSRAAAYIGLGTRLLWK